MLPTHQNKADEDGALVDEYNAQPLALVHLSAVLPAHSEVADSACRWYCAGHVQLVFFVERVPIRQDAVMSLLASSRAFDRRRGGCSWWGRRVRITILAAKATYCGA